MGSIQFVNIADVENPATGMTYRQENMVKEHQIPLKSLVEVKTSDEDFPYEGVRAFVVSHDRDCDETPLYSISLNRDWKPGRNQRWEDNGKSYMIQGELIQRAAKENGFSEECLVVIKRHVEEKTS